MIKESPFIRSAMLLGKESVERLARSAVLLCGVGGVGSYTAEGLARAGVGRLALVDHDRVALSNCNRQLEALRSTLGQPKAQAMAQRILDVNPDCQVEVFDLFYGPDTCRILDLSSYDYIVDAIDTVTAKLLLIQRAKEAGVPIVSCMGTGNKLDPSRFRISDISKTSVCPLARVMRRELKRRGVDHVDALWSDEPPLTPLPLVPPNPETQKQTPGSLPFVPSVAGLMIAGHVTLNLCRQAGAGGRT